MDESAKVWCERTAFAGFDWAHDHHDVVVEDQQGTVVDDFRFEETADGWKLLIERLSRHPDVTVAI